MLVPNSRITPERCLGREEVTLSCPAGDMSGGACSGLVRGFALSLVSTSLFHELVLRLLQICFSGGDCSYRVLPFENFLQCILELDSVVVEDSWKLSFSFLRFKK